MKLYLVLSFVQLFHCSVLPPSNRLPNALDFLVLGDWGYTNSSLQDGQKKVAAAMQEFSQKTILPDFIVAVGDNFYYGGDYNYDGIMSVIDDKWEDMWLNVYDQSLSTVPWFAVLGNHDCKLIILKQNIKKRAFYE